MLNTSSKKIEKEFKDLRGNLLDLTLKNQLLNFKPRAKTLTVVNQSATNVYQSLVLQNKKMYFTTNKKDQKDDSKFSIWDHSPIDLSRFTEGDKTLQTNLTPNELQKRLFYINQQAKTMIDEQGYNILYLAIGFLEWMDNAKPDQKNFAPLVLIPVTMERKKVGKSFELSWTGEELQTNISLKAKLKEEGIKLPEFTPKNYIEVVEHYIRDVKHAVSKMKKWKVNSNVALGFFSFTKFVMFNDLNPESWDDNVDLTKNELIESIFNPNKNTQEGFKEEEIDEKLEYKDMYQVLDADSSQIAAIEDVKAGRNLVVEGPPGTGKSQTIVNLIAELLAEGKSVLFVSEKMAALDVVKDRLNRVGLSKFVLELHSHKTRRKKFLKELEKAANVRSERTINIDQTLRKLEKLKNQLDDYAEVIHKPSYGVELSAFELYGMKESADDYFSKKNSMIPLIRFNNPQTITLKDLDDIIISLENLAELYQTISSDNPWNNCAPKSLLPADLREIEQLIYDTLFSLDNFSLEMEKVYEGYGFKKPNSLEDFNLSLTAFDLFEDNLFNLIDGNVLKSNIWFKNSKDADTLIKKLEEYQLSSKIFDKFNSEILRVDLNQLINSVKKVSSKKFSLFKNKQTAEIVESYYKTNVPSKDSIIKDLETIRTATHLKQELENNQNLAIGYFGNVWHLDASITDLKNISSWMTKFNNLLNEGIISETTINIFSKDLFNVNPRNDLNDYIKLGGDFKDKLSKLESKLNPRSKLIFKKDSNYVTLEEWRNQLNLWKGQLSSLHLWSQYLNTKNSLENTMAEDFIESIEKRNISVEDVRFLVYGNFADSLLNIIFIENQELSTFIGELHENRIKEFKDLDKKIIELNRKRIFQKLNKNIPKIFGATNNPEAKILAGEFTRKSGHLPVRVLLEKAGGMIKQIKPCFMMSPLSIAQYLDPTNEKLQFDVVIFDEASQVKPEDALGAFMRGKTAVVMGDTQQLPPTSFFDQIAAGESGEEVAGALDMESILHLCKLSFPVKMLKWHYRSRHESLIAVSNKEFYDDELLVYPSPSSNDPELGLKFNYNSNTVYDRGSGSVNKLEAHDVVKEIFKHFDKYGDSKSLGVGTFSVAQKNAILEQLELERKNRPELEPLFSDKLDEKFFVKNLETIQGDERDVILISIGYGFDENRKMSLNFGPLNQDGGERRLNVLVTRAREKCVVFSNFRSYDMHLTANPPFGVKSLKEFLFYAENVSAGNLINEELDDEPFEDAIYNFLTEQGYEVHKQIGCAGFRVNLAISSEISGRYILGIITDGKMYSSSKVARDRDRLREQVLDGLGWKLYRLWSTDWYRNRKLTQEKLLKTIENTKILAIKEETKRTEDAEKLQELLKKEAELRVLELEKEEEEEIIAESDLNSKKDIIDDNLEEDNIIDANDEIIEVKPEEVINESYDDYVEIDTSSVHDDGEMDDYVEIDTYPHLDDSPVIEDTNEDSSSEDSESLISSIIKNLTKSEEKEEEIEEDEDISPISKIKFKPSINLDSDDDYSIDNTSTIKNDEISEENNSIINEEATIKTMEPHENIVNNNGEDLFNDDPNENHDFEDDTPISELINNPEEELYEGVSNIDNPLKKNSIYYRDYDDEENKKKSVLESINDLKREMSYINKSLKEIEHPTPPEIVQIIDRTQKIDTNALKESIGKNDTESLDNLNDLESIIEKVSEDYKNLEKDRFKAKNTLKTSDDEYIPKKGSKMEDEIFTYEIANNPNLFTKDVYSMTSIELGNSIKEIVNIEGPIHIDQLIKRIKELSNAKRSTAKFKNAIGEGIKEEEKLENIVLINDFLYDATNLKIPIRKREKPNIDLIANEEIEENIKTVLKFNQFVPSKSLIKTVAHNFGFKSTSKKTSEQISKVLDSMLAEGKIVILGDQIQLK